MLAPNCELYGLTKGQFSLLDLVIAVLTQTGPAHVTVSTWTAAQAAIDESYKLLTENAVLSLRWLVDFSFLRRQPKYCELLVRRFGRDVIRVTKNHAKFIIVRNKRWNVAIRTSMNLNHNPRLENFEISDDPALCDFLESVVDEIFETHTPAFDDLRPQDHVNAFLGFDAQDAGRDQSQHLGMSPEALLRSPG